MSDGTATAATASAMRPVAPALPVPRWLEGAAELAPLLLRAGELRPLLAVGVPGGSARNSLLLHVDLIDQKLLIDRPQPALLDPPPARLSLSTRIDGGALDFVADLEGQAEFDGEPALLLRWPTRARYLQRRAAYRLGIPREVPTLPVRFDNPELSFMGTLVDLSRHGAGALVPSSTRIREGDLLSCRLRIGDLDIDAEVEVRSRTPRLDRMRMGLRFARLSSGSAERLSAAVARLERAQLRRAAERRTRLGP
ncbi:MAG: PilZ domain-containing protein [Stagnimonas sp.]|nr:PilZ domain-containing protein [Stagnimonas sp.]